MKKIFSLLFVLIFMSSFPLAYAQSPDGMDSQLLAIEETLLQIRQTQQQITEKQAQMNEELASLRIIINRFGRG